jgi:MULE transposase domain
MEMSQNSQNSSEIDLEGSDSNGSSWEGFGNDVIDGEDDQWNQEYAREWGTAQNQAEEALTSGPNAPPPTHRLDGSKRQFESLESALQYCQIWAQEHGYAIAQRRVKNDAQNTPYRAFFYCDRGRRYTPTPKAPGAGKRKTSTRRIECLFALAIGRERKNLQGYFSIDISHPHHNHEASSKATVHPIHRRLARKDNPAILDQIQHNKEAGITPAQTLQALRLQFPEIPLIQKDIENKYGDIKRLMNRGLPAIQAMIQKLGENYRFVYSMDDRDRLVRVLFLHNKMLEILPLYPNLLIIDATYKLNRFNIPLVNVVGVTATNASFVIGQAFLTFEAEEDYYWLLKELQDIRNEAQLPPPSAIITDMAGGLHNACKRVFPDVPLMLCIWHINKNVLKYCGDMWIAETRGILTDEERQVRVRGLTETFNDRWQRVLYAKSEQEFEAAWAALESRYRNSYPMLLTYLRQHYIDGDTEKTFIPAWTDKIRHFGNQASSRVEGIHRAVKAGLKARSGHLNDVLDHLSRFLQLHNDRIWHSLEEERLKRRVDLQANLYLNLHGHISSYAMDQVENHRQYFNLTPQSPLNALRPCTNVFSTTMGLPCAHILQERMHGVTGRLELDDFDLQWRIDRPGTLRRPMTLEERLRDPQVIRERLPASQRRGRSKHQREAQREPSGFENTQTEINNTPAVRQRARGGRGRGRPRGRRRGRGRGRGVAGGGGARAVEANTQVSEVQELNHDSDSDDPLNTTFEAISQRHRQALRTSQAEIESPASTGQLRLTQLIDSDSDLPGMGGILSGRSSAQEVVDIDDIDTEEAVEEVDLI